MQNDSNVVGRTILEQLGGSRRLEVMAGATGMWVGHRSAGFRLGAGAKSPDGRTIKIVRVLLMPSDTYRVEFWSAGAKTLVTVREDVYADALMDVFEAETGVFLTFRKRGTR